MPKVMHQRYSSHSFRTVHAFLSIIFTIARSNPFIPSCMMGTYCDTSHARDTDFLVYFCRIVLVDGTNWTSGSTETALVHALVALGTIPALATFR